MAAETPSTEPQWLKKTVQAARERVKILTDHDSHPIAAMAQSGKLCPGLNAYQLKAAREEHQQRVEAGQRALARTTNVRSSHVPGLVCGDAEILRQVETLVGLASAEGWDYLALEGDIVLLPDSLDRTHIPGLQIFSVNSDTLAKVPEFAWRLKFVYAGHLHDAALIEAGLPEAHQDQLVWTKFQIDKAYNRAETRFGQLHREVEDLHARSVVTAKTMRREITDLQRSNSELRSKIDEMEARFAQVARAFGALAVPSGNSEARRPTDGPSHSHPTSDFVSVGTGRPVATTDYHAEGTFSEPRRGESVPAIGRRELPGLGCVYESVRTGSHGDLTEIARTGHGIDETPVKPDAPEVARSHHGLDETPVESDAPEVAQGHNGLDGIPAVSKAEYPVTVRGVDGAVATHYDAGAAHQDAVTAHHDAVVAHHDAVAARSDVSGPIDRPAKLNPVSSRIFTSADETIKRGGSVVEATKDLMDALDTSATASAAPAGSQATAQPKKSTKSNKKSRR